MPYAMPSPHSPEAHHFDLPPLKLRQRHRRSRSSTVSNFSDEKGPGAFSGLPNLPRRKSHSSAAAAPAEKKTLFHFDQDSDSSDDQPQSQPQPHTLQQHTMNALGLTVDTKNLQPGSQIESAPPLMDNTMLQTSTLPFPTRGSPLPSPSPPSPSKSASIPRTPSTPIILSNGKPLKPSLKSAQSSPHISGIRLHARAQSEPSTPMGGTVKNVHFPDKDLQSVRLFNSSGRPANVNRTGAGEETETETEYDSSSNTNNFASSYGAAVFDSQSGFPFPSVSAITSPTSSPSIEYELDPQVSDPVPHMHPPAYANVHFETLTLPHARPLMLRGSILVRNVAFCKDVAVRFTIDNWQTTSEVLCKHVASLPALPQPFPTPTTEGDLAAVAGKSQEPSWDRFSFGIRLEDFERKLADKRMVLVIRYTAHGAGEWWDNNSGKNYNVGFRKVTVSSSTPSVAGMSAPMNEQQKPTVKVSDTVANRSPVTGNSQQRTFSAPSTLKSTPTTEVAMQQAVADGVLPRLAIPSPQPGSRRHNNIFSQQTPSQSPFPARPSMPQRTHSSPQPMSNMSSRPNTMRSSLPSKLNLLNYAAPSRTISKPRFVGLPEDDETGKTEERGEPQSPNSELPEGLPLSMSMSMVNGMPATAPRYDYTWSLSSSSTSNPQQKTESSPAMTPSSSTSSLSPSPPPSYSVLPPAEHEQQQRALSPPLAAGAGPLSPTDSSYAALLKQWCFAQSPTPSPSLTPPTGATPTAAATPMGDMGNIVGAAWRGLGERMYGNGNGGMFMNGMRSESPMIAGM